MKSIIEASENNLDELTKMGIALWPEDSYSSLEEIFSEIIPSEDKKVLLSMENDEPTGFIFISVRTDYVEGSESSPTGYVEGIYVKEEYRRTGIAKKLLAAGEKWLKEMGCSKVGSDAYIDNKISYDFHIKAGFKEAAKLVTFIKDIE